ncbi:MAG: FCD domain-containing protein [Acuticoccus sp.]
MSNIDLVDHLREPPPLKNTTLDDLKTWLHTSGVRPGDKLPPERRLSEVLGVSRGELRKALTILEVNGCLKRHVGRGTYLSGDPQAPSEGDTVDIATLAEHTSPHEAMMTRLALEPQIAGQAAIHGTAREIAEAESLALAMRAAPDWPTYESLDAAFHETIASAAGNSLLAELHRIMNTVRIRVLWARLDVPRGGPPPDYHSFAEHDAIVDALRRRDKAGAQQAMLAHLRSIGATLLAD